MNELDQLGSWVVEYTDGTHLAQYDSSHPSAIGGEVPFRMIEWPRVDTLVLESQLVRSVFKVLQPPDGYRLSLRRRTVQSTQADSTGTTIAFCTRHLLAPYRPGPRLS
jgi:hypothetical protein